ncbi:MAG TPA: ComF family protein, partial [Tichowtungia sp.]|nr:ComF family protein [Tichowtungia sp.]
MISLICDTGIGTAGGKSGFFFLRHLSRAAIIIYYSVVLDVIYPRNCVRCGAVSPEPMRYICWDCLADMPNVEAPFCERCGDPVAGDVQHDYTCFACSRKTPDFDLARSAVRYEGAVGEALRALKYDHALWVADDLAELLFACVRAEYSSLTFDVVTSVPLHSARRRARGFNQSALLGRLLARRIKCLYREKSVRRIRPTVTQTGLTAPQRTANVFGAFRAGIFSRLNGKRILVVDDVMTTGATVNACAAALKKGGAAS